MIPPEANLATEDQTMPENQSGLMTMEQIAEQLQVAPRTVRGWVKKGWIPEVRISGTVCRFVLADVVEALKKRSVGRTPRMK